LEKRQASQREKEEREIRFRVIEEFLNLRGRNESNFASWAAILDSNFSLTVPATELSDWNGRDDAQVGKGAAKIEEVHTGVGDVMDESTRFTQFLASLETVASREYNTIRCLYSCDRKDFFMDDSHAVLDFCANTTGLTRGELFIRGSIRSSFCPASNKLLNATLIYDTGAFIHRMTSVAEARAASHRADEILDSLQMPHVDTAVAVVPQGGESSDEGH